MTDNTENDEVITLIETDKPKKVKKKRTYEEQKERIKAYIKNRWANDEEFRKNQSAKKIERQKIRYNTDEEYRQRILEKGKQKRLENKNLKTDEMILNLESLLTGDIENDDIEMIRKLYNKIISVRPDYKLKKTN